MRATLEADFNDFLSDLDKVSTRLRDKFSGDVDRASGKLQRLTDSLDGNRTLQQAGLMAAAVTRLGGAATLTDRELARIAPTIDEAYQKFQRLGRDVPKDLQRLKSELDRLREPLVATRVEANNLQSVLGTLGAPIAQGLGIGAGLTIASSLESVASTVRDQLSDVVRLGDEYARLRLGFDALQGSVTRGDETLRTLRSSARGLVTDIALIQQASQASVLGLDKLGADMGEVVAIATRLGAALGKDASKSIDQFSLALAKGSSERLDELGISLRLNEAYDEYAARIDKTAEKLTELEKKQAFAQIALERGREVVAKLGDVSLTTGQQIDRIGVAFENLKTAIGAGAVGGGPIADFLGGVADEAARVVDEVDAAKRALRELAGLIPEGARPPQGLASAVGAGLTEALINQYFGSNRAALLMLRRDTDRLQRFGVIDPTLPEPTAGAIRDRDGSTRQAAKPFDLTSLVPELPRLDFGERDMAFAERQIERALDEQKRLNDKAERLDKERQRLNDARQKRLDTLSGRAIVAEALAGFDDLAAVDLNGTKESVLKVFDGLVEAREVARRLEPNAVAGITGLLEVLATKPEVAESVRKAGAAILKPLSDPAQLNTLLTQGTGFRNAGVLAGKELTEGLTGGLSRLRNGRILDELAVFTLPKIDIANSGGQYAAIADNAERTTLIFQEMKKSLEGLGIPLDEITKRTQKAIAQGRDWRGAVSGVAQAFSQLAQIAGGAFDNISRSIGTVFGAADAALETVTALGKQFQSLLKRDENGNVLGLSAGGRALGGALAGIGVGSQLGSLFTNRGAGFAAGAAGGAGAGFLAGGYLGAGVGALVGGFAGLFAAAANAAAQRAAKDISASQLTAQFGGLDALLGVVGRLGLNQQTFLERFYGEPKEFGKAVTELNTALEKERLEADKLTKSLQAVVKVQGVLSVGQINAISDVRPGSPAEGPLAEFFAAQRQQTADGLARAVDALSRNASLSQAETEALTKGVRDQEERDRILEDALGRKAKQTLTDFGAGAKAASAGLFVLFDEAVRRGDSAVDALSNLREPIGQLRDLYSRAGLTPGSGFQQLSGLFDIATGDQTGTAVQLASGLGSALSGFQNQGLLSQELFADLTSGISESYFTLEALGKGGLDAARLMQPGLQSIFQLQKDFGFEVDANAQKLLDFAESSGLIGDQFRPAAELMVDGINRVIDRLDVLIQTLGGDLPEAQRRASRDVNPAGPKTPSLPSVPDPGGNAGVPDPTSFRVEVGDTAVYVTLDGDQVAEAVVRRVPSIVERVR